MSTDSIQEFLKLLRTDENKASNLLFQNYYTLLCNIVNRIVADRDLSEDIVQEVFIKLWQKRKDLQIQSSLKNYLHRAVINEAISYLRKNSKNDFVDAESNEIKAENESLHDSNIDTKELKYKVRKAINTLPPKCKAIFTLSRFNSYNNKEIAEIMEISVKTVENQMTIALRKLKEKLS